MRRLRQTAYAGMFPVVLSVIPCDMDALLHACHASKQVREIVGLTGRSVARSFRGRWISSSHVWVRHHGPEGSRGNFAERLHEQATEVMGSGMAR